MTGPLPFSPRFKIARKAVRDVLLGNRSHGRVFLQQIRTADLQPFSRNRIPRSHRFKHVVVRNGNRLLADRSGEKNQSRLTLRRKTGCLLDPLFVTALVFRKRASRIVFRFIVDQLVTLRTKKHEILESLNLLRTRPNAPPRSISPERNNVGHLREIALGQSHRMFHQIPWAAIEFASTTGANEQQQARQIRNTPDLDHRAQRCTGFAFLVPLCARRFHAAAPTISPTDCVPANPDEFPRRASSRFPATSRKPPATGTSTE